MRKDSAGSGFVRQEIEALSGQYPQALSGRILPDLYHIVFRLVFVQDRNWAPHAAAVAAGVDLLGQIPAYGPLLAEGNEPDQVWNMGLHDPGGALLVPVHEGAVVDQPGALGIPANEALQRLPGKLMAVQHGVPNVLGYRLKVQRGPRVLMPYQQPAFS